MSAGQVIAMKELNVAIEGLPEDWKSHVKSILSSKPPARATISDEKPGDDGEYESAVVTISPADDDASMCVVACECGDDNCFHAKVFWRLLVEEAAKKRQTKKKDAPAKELTEEELDKRRGPGQADVGNMSTVVGDPHTDDPGNPNLEVWRELNRPPSSALKRIGGGRLKGMTDINPQWRYKALTAQFGMCGFGWKYTVDSKWIVPGHGDEQIAFADISLYVKVDGEWSEAIPGHGGSKFVAREKEGPYNNDEAYKMAITDALSTACKMLGVAADIYMGLWDGSKYAISG